VATISSSSSASIGQSVLSQLQLQQAQRNAERADANARSLQAQAREAQQIAVQAQAEARSISSQADQAQSEASQAKLSLAVIRNGGQVQSDLAGAVGNVVETLKVASPVAATPSPTVPVVNTQGQLTGTVVNTTA
jgi:hypothetical protein